MIHVVRVTAKTECDPAGEDLLAEIRRTLGHAEIARVRTAHVYRIEGISAAEAETLAEQLLCEGVNHRWTLGAPVITDADRLVEVTYLPGVMNPEAASILKSALCLGIEPTAVDASREYAFYAAAGQKIPAAAIEEILHRLLLNPTVQQVVTAEPETLTIAGETGATKRIAIRTMDDAALAALSAEGLYLEPDEMRAIQDYFVELERDPTDLELEALAQTWSEHCVHKTFKRALRIDGEAKAPMMRRLKQTSEMYDDLILSAFVDNSGVMDFYDGWAICGKVETHNSPSAIEPYGGAMTGSGGVFRDILGTGRGAKVVASTDMFCFAPPDLPEGEIPPGALPPDYLLRQVVAGVRDYGNRMGIPTNNGSLHFHPDFRAKPTVIVGAYGLLPVAAAPKGEPRDGDRVIALGGRTGRDGIHGATFSSVQMTADTMSVNSQAVQIGNAVEEKRLLDAVLECRDAGLIQAITDCGAGGFSSAVGEMGEEIGVHVELERAPLKYAGLAPWEVFLSESQERMVLAVAPENVAAVRAICATYNVEVSDLGTFEDTGKLHVTWHGETVADLSMHFLHDGLPEKTLEGRSALVADGDGDAPGARPEAPSDPAGWIALAEVVMAHPNVCSKEPIVRQYDHTVQGGSALPPYGGAEGDAPGDAAILAPLLGKPYGLIVSHGMHPALNLLDPYWGSVWAAAEALSNYAAVGGDVREASLIDNFIWPVPEGEQLASLSRAVDACVDVMHAVRRPFISGKDSLSSTYRYPDGRVLHIPPVLCVSVFGRIPDVRRTASSALQRAGSRLVLVGARDAGGLGGSAYLDAMASGGGSNGASGNGQATGRVPRVDLDLLPRTLAAIHAAIRDGHVASCHDLSEGGLLAAAAEMGFGGDYGVALDLARLVATGERVEEALFAETAGVFLVELAEGADPTVVFGGDVSGDAGAGGDGAGGSDAPGVPWVDVGRTTEAETLAVRSGAVDVFEVGLTALQAAWERPMRAVFH